MFAVLATSACPPASLVGQPCETAGTPQCEDDALLRCDGSVYVQLASCASECVKDKAPIAHNQPISSDETWACEAGPHLVNSTITVQNGATLTIEAGSLVRIVSASRINTDIAGRIASLGTQNAPVLVTSDSGDPSGFGAGAEGGLNVFAVEAGEPSIVDNTIIERGVNGLGVFGLSATATPPTVTNNTLRDNTQFGIVISCNSVNPPIPDFAAAGNQFFSNGGEVAPCP